MINSIIEYKEIKDDEKRKIYSRERQTNQRPTNLLRKVAAMMKDKQSMVRIKLSGKKAHRNPNLEVAIIKATSHDELVMDYKNANRVFDWIKTSPTFLRPFFWCITRRIEKTGNWIVALKSLMLVHGVFCTKVTGIRKIGRLPFNLSSFRDRYLKPTRAWSFSAFVRSYYAFLDQKSAFMCYEYEEEEEEMREGGLSICASISRLQRLQMLLDLLLQIKPYDEGMEVVIVLDAMDCVLIEIFDLYSGICQGVAHMLCSLLSMKTTEAAMALHILDTVTSQKCQLAEYFEECRRMGVLNAMEFPTVEQQIPEGDICNVKGIIHEMLEKGSLGFAEEEKPGTSGRECQEEEEEFKAMSKTIVTKNWVVFNDEMEVDGGKGGEGNGGRGGKKDLLYDFGTSLDVGGRKNFNGLWHLQREPKNLMLVPYNGLRLSKIDERELACT